MKPRTGYVYRDGKSWVARLTYTDLETGKRKQLKRYAPTKTEASELLQTLRQTLKDHGAKPLDGERMAVSQLADHYIKARLKPAEYHGERKISGLRSYQSPRSHAETIKNFFGSKRLKAVTPSD
ncbi:MAG: hypothetical protein ACREEM_48930, partial [Blastocatellia bacterium]